MQTQPQTATQTGVDVYYLPFGDSDDKEWSELLTTLRSKLRFDDDYELRQSDFETFYENQGHDAKATLNNVFPRWNAGSGQESEAFARRECDDCDAVFTGRRDSPDHGPDENPISLSVRQRRAEKHERETRSAPHKRDGHTVGHGHRSMSVGDIIVDAEGVAHLIRPFSIEAQPHIEVDG